MADRLGTRRVQTNPFGNLDESCQSLPFGDNLVCSGEESTKHPFTGKEHDNESGNDYFAARNYRSTTGRPNWSAKEEPVPYARPDNPQSLNL